MVLFKKNRDKEDKDPILFRKYCFKPAVINDKYGFSGKDDDTVCLIRISGGLSALKFDTTLIDLASSSVLQKGIYDEAYLETQGFTISKFPKEVRISKGFYTIALKPNENGIEYIGMYKHRLYPFQKYKL